MSIYNVFLLAEISVSGSSSISAFSKKKAEDEANQQHSQSQIRWTYQGQHVGQYNGPLRSVWAVEADTNIFQVSLIADVFISAAVLNVEADNSQEVIKNILAENPNGTLPWNFKNVKLEYAGPVSKIWTIPTV